MFTDIVGSTAMKGKMPGATSEERQQAFLERIKAPHERIVRECVDARAGHVVKGTGDGFLIAFSDAEQAVLCGLEIQRRLAAAAIFTPEGTLQIRIGLHSGQATPHDGDYTASAVDKAARVESKAALGAVYLSRETRGVIDGKIRGVTTASTDSHSMKGVGEEELFVASSAGGSPPSAPTIAPVSAPVRTSIRHNLPTLQPFFGREEELRKIAEALDPENRGWGALIDGPGGMGKTSLAVRAAYDASPDDFERILFISLKTRELDDDGVRDLSGFLISGLAELFGELARELGREDIVKAPGDQRPRLLVEALRSTRILLVLDNLESLTKPERDTLFTFINKLPVGCKAILTSRQRVGSGAQELILEKLSEEAALATLEELATHNPALAKTSEAERIALYTQTGGKPLLLRWTAGQIGRGHCVTFTDALAYLRSCPEGNDPLEFIFGDLVGDFSPEEEKVLCALTYFSLPAKMEHIRAIAEPLSEAERKRLEQAEKYGEDAHLFRDEKGPVETPRQFFDEQIDRALRSLVNRSLVVPSDEFQTFALVPMVADFLRKAKPAAVAETGDRLEKRAYALIVENGYEKHNRFPVLDAAWPSVAPSIPRFLAGPNARLQTVCDAFDNFLDFTGRWDERLALSVQAEGKAVAAGDYRNAGWRAYQAGWDHHLRGQAEEVLVCADRATEHWARAFPPGRGTAAGSRERALALRLRGVGYWLKKDYPAAIAAYREVVELIGRLSTESEDMAIALNDLASAESDSGDFAAAELDYREAQRIARVVNQAEIVAGSTGNLAGLALDREDWPGAEPLAREALTLAEKVGRQQLIASNCYRLAVALARQGKGAEGRSYARRAVEIYQKLGSPHLESARETLRECEG